MIAHLAKVAPQPASHADLLVAVWNLQPTTRTQTVTQAIRRLRLKLEPDASEPQLILSESGVGYRLAHSPRPPTHPRLPVERDAFLGRERETARIIDWWASGHRLVTVAGLGGIGKTRLGLHAARRYSKRDVWFVDLSPSRGLDDVVSRILDAVGVESVGPTQQKGERNSWTGASGLASLDQVRKAVQDGLIVLDNAEHVLSAARKVVDDWLDATQASFLVTSRHWLALAGERVLELGPLDPRDARELWFARSPERPEAGDIEDSGLVDAILERLEGIPLAIELAAARTSSLSVSAILGSLGDSERPRNGRAAGRQGTMTRCLAWSWNLLAPVERAVLAQCAVFRGSFTATAAEAIVQLPEGSPPLVEVLASLVEQSLLRADTGRAVARYRLFLVLAAFVRSVVPPSNALALRHATHFAQCSRSAFPYADLSRHAALLADVDELRAALRFAREHHAPELASDLAAGLARTLGSQQPALVADAIRWMKPLLVDDVPRLAQYLMIEASLARMSYDLEGCESKLRELLSLPIGPGLRGQALTLRGSLWLVRADFEQARRWYLEAIRTLPPENEGFLGGAVDNLAAVDGLLGNFAAAMAGHRRALALHRKHGSAVGETRSLGNLASLHYRDGDVVAAVQCMQRSIELAEQLGLASSELLQRTKLADLRRHEGDLEVAEVHTRRAVALAAKLGSPRLQMWAWRTRAQVELAVGHDATEALSRALEAARRSGLAWGPGLVDLVWAEAHMLAKQLPRAQGRVNDALESLRSAPEPLDLVSAWTMKGRIAIAEHAMDDARAAL
ncbi:MAG: winged helix-turn-helix domain-containing protein, partial [Myxococcota bacterium]